MNESVVGPYGPQPQAVPRILELVSRRIASMAKSIVDTEATALLPDEMHDSEIVSIGYRMFPLTLQYIGAGRMPARDDLDVVRERAAQRAREGVPLSLVLGLWQRGFQLVYDECRRAADGDDAALGWIGAMGLRVEQVYVAELVEAYQQERAIQAEDATGGPQFVGRLLLLGHDPRADAERLDVRLTSTYHVLAVRIGRTPGEQSAKESARDVAGRRKLHRVQRLFRPDGGPATLSMLDRDGGTVLVPVSSTETDPYSGLRRLVAAIAGAAGAPVSAAVVDTVARTAVKQAAVDAAEVLRVAVALGLPPGLHRLDDVAAAYQLSRPGPGADFLSETIGPILDRPDLLRTLRSYLACDLDRLRVARELGVHPNTVNNRLNKVEQLCGASPFRTDGIVALYAALVARGVAEQSG